MILRFIALAFISMMFLACNEDVLEVDPQEQIKAYVGKYSVNGTAINGLITYYDSIGNQIGMGFDTIHFHKEIIEISLQGHTDTLLVDGLLYSWYLDHPKKKVQGVLENGLINIIYDKSDIVFNRKIVGSINIQGEVIDIDYLWDRSDVWSAGAIPVKGTVTVEGNRID